MPKVTLTDGWMMLVLPLLEMALIVAVAFTTGTAYHWAFYDAAPSVRYTTVVGLLVGLLFTLPFIFRNEYRIATRLDGRRSSWRIFVIWTYAFLSLGVIAFMTKTTSIYSRGWAMGFYACGLIALLIADRILIEVLQRASASGHVARQRVALVGFPHEIARAQARLERDQAKINIVSVISLKANVGAGSGEGTMIATREAIHRLRAARAQDVIVAVPWFETAVIEELVSELSELPVAVHLIGASLLDRFEAPRAAHIGAITALTLSPEPLTLLERIFKRAFDIAVAALALLTLAPFFLVIAWLIRRDSPGPVIFWQRRRGFNHEEFRIAKFRTMTTTEDGDHVPQAKAGDARVTRIGAFLRRWSIDELPQLWNVLKGEMSIVGPRPHAVAHDRLFEERIEGYPRRLNVKPGITGWAQVHGLRGETDTDEKMKARVEHDLYYIDNWSVALDLAIVFRTVFSARSHLNAH